MSEKIGGAKGTEIDEQFQFMEKKTDIIYRLIEDVHFRTNEYLQPNPGSYNSKWIIIVTIFWGIDDLFFYFFDVLSFQNFWLSSIDRSWRTDYEYFTLFYIIRTSYGLQICSIRIFAKKNFMPKCFERKLVIGKENDIFLISSLRSAFLTIKFNNKTSWFTENTYWN